MSTTAQTKRTDEEPEAGAKKPRLIGAALHTYRALRYRNFRLFFGGQSISLIGTWMTRIATSWLIYRLTHSALLLGMVSFAGQLPTFLLAPFAGVWIDRLDRRQVLVWTQVLSMMQSFLLAIFTFSGHITVAWVLGLGVMQGIINSFDMPGRQSFLVQMVDDKADLSNAIAINSSMANMARLVGPSLAGMVIAATNEAWCFLLDGISYLFVIASLLMMRIYAPVIEKKASSTLTALKEGWSYVTGSVPIRTILLLFALISLMGFPFVVLMPIFAAKVLHGGPHTLGFLMGAVGVGAFFSALQLAARKSVRGLIRMIPIAAVVFAAGLIVLGLSHVFWLSALGALVAGMGMMQGMAASNTVIQTVVSEDKRGRVMSYYTMAFVGMAPFGSLLAGTMASLVGAPWTVIGNGLVVLLGAMWFFTQRPALRRAVRPIYEELGILPPREEITPAEGMPS